MNVGDGATCSSNARSATVRTYGVLLEGRAQKKITFTARGSMQRGLPDAWVRGCSLKRALEEPEWQRSAMEAITGWTRTLASRLASSS